MAGDAHAEQLDRLDALSDDAFRLEIGDWIEANYPDGMARHCPPLFWRENRE